MTLVAKLDKVSYMYPRSETLVLRDISLRVQEGEFLGVIGPTGAGKTTLCMTFNGIVPQFYGGRFFGRVTVMGMDSLEQPISTLAQYVGTVFEDPETQLTATSVENEIAFALENLKIPRDEIRRRIPEVLAAVRLEGKETRHPAELSGGEKQRLAIAAALALRPSLLVLDEPTSQLDPVGAQEIFATARELNTELGVTIVMASHAAEEMAEHADRIGVLSHGRLVQVGTPDEVYAAVEDLYAHDLRPPQVAQTFHRMRQAGVPVSTIPVRLDEGAARLRELVDGYATAHALQSRKPIASGAGRPDAPCPEPAPSPQLSVRDLVFVYDDGTEALKEISLDIHKGEYVLIAGQNGAGKSTLVKHFLKLLTPTAGVVVVEGRDLVAWTTSQLAARIGYVAQNPDNQIFNETVEDEVMFALRNRPVRDRLPPSEIEGRVTESLSAMALLHVRRRHPLSLPKGDRARVVIAAILAMQPDIVIFDEPTTGQDYRGAMAILEISRRLHAMGKTVIVITHHLYLMPQYAERAVIMGKGTILMDAPIRQALHATEVLTATYLTPPQAVLLAQAVCPEMEAPPLYTPEEVADCAAAAWESRPRDDDQSSRGASNA